MRRIAIAAGIAGVIYGIAVGAGLLLYATGAIASGATHNNCTGYKQQIADEREIGEEDVPQAEIKRRTQECLDQQAVTGGEALRGEYLFWSLWPAGTSALIYLVWPRWARILLLQLDKNGGSANTEFRYMSAERRTSTGGAPQN